MTSSKKRIIVGVVCFAAFFLHIVAPILSSVIPYIAFCLCLFIVSRKPRKIIGMLAALFVGLAVIPAFDFWFYLRTALVPESVIDNILLESVGTCVYFALFILVGVWVSHEKPKFTLATGLLTIFGIVVCVCLSGIRAAMITSALDGAASQGNWLGWLSIFETTPIVKLAKMAFYAALWGTSSSFTKE